MTETQATEKSSAQRQIVGKVISGKMNKTIVVQVERKVKHPLYGKYLRKFSKMYAHDEDNACQVGDLVLIQQTRPLSKTKRWKLVEILKREDQQ
jgi:small subunit ribosomal protein S17